MRFVRRATVDAAAVLGAIALGAAWVAGPGAGVGVLAGGAIAVGNLWWLSLRAVAVVFASGLVHPLAVVAGLTVLPVVVIVRGLAVAREASASS